jgi:hypothetical protein
MGLDSLSYLPELYPYLWMSSNDETGETSWNVSTVELDQEDAPFGSHCHEDHTIHL